MTELEKIKRYISETIKSPMEKYDMSYSECLEIKNQSKSEGLVEGIALAFEYGRAKGYRAAKAEMRNGVK